jgi:hypothetical protein
VCALHGHALQHAVHELRALPECLMCLSSESTQSHHIINCSLNVP